MRSMFYSISLFLLQWEFYHNIEAKNLCSVPLEWTCSEVERHPGEVSFLREKLYSFKSQDFKYIEFSKWRNPTQSMEFKDIERKFTNWQFHLRVQNCGPDEGNRISSIENQTKVTKKSVRLIDFQSQHFLRWLPE